MNYYFDESGNWSGLEHKHLVLGGLLIKDKSIERRLDREFKLLQAENNIESLHAMDLSENQKELCYQIINNALGYETAVLMRVYDKNKSSTKSQKKSDEIYSELAADLVTTISYGDKLVNVYYDMKFYYAYPANVLYCMNKNKPYYYKKMKQKFSISDSHFLSTRNKLMTRLQSLINKRKVYGYQKKNIEEFLDGISDTELSLNPFDAKSIDKLEIEKNKVKNQISDYLWSELWLQIEGSEQAKENFRSNIIRSYKNKNNLFNTDSTIPTLKIKFANKQEENPGVQVIDFICNMIYRNGTKVPTNASNSIKSIYSKISIEEIR